MRPRFAIERVGRRRYAAARGMARRGFSALMIHLVLRVRLETAQMLVAGRSPGLWSGPEQALFREAGR